MSSIKPQHYTPASWWSITAQTSYQRPPMKLMRALRGNCFMYDVYNNKVQNECIPSHTSNQSTVRVASYNIRFFTNIFGKNKQIKILENIKLINADIIVLQEFDQQSSLSKALSLDDLMTYFNNMGYVYAGLDTFISCNKNDGPIGTIIFSKHPLQSAFRKRFTPHIKHKNNQGFTNIKCTINNTTFSLYGFHLAAEFYPPSLRYAEQVRYEQIKEVVEYAQHDQADVVLLLGDFNTFNTQNYYDHTIRNVSLWNMIDQEYKEYVGISRPTNTLDFLLSCGFKTSFALCAQQEPFYTNWTGLNVDHIFSKRMINLQGSYVYYDASSDHCPIIVDILTNC